MNIATRFKFNGAELIGLCVIAGTSALSFLKALGVNLNLTLIITILSVVIFMFTSKDDKKIGAFRIAYIFVIIFWISSLLIFVESIYQNKLPATYQFHKFSLIFLCPLAYYLGLVFIKNSSIVKINEILKINIFVCAAFIFFKIMNGNNSSEESEVLGSYYQYIGDSLALSALLAYSDVLKRKNVQISGIFVQGLVILMLFAMGSRASVVSYCAAIIATRYAFVFIGIAVALGLFLYQLADWLDESALEFRAVNSIVNMLQSRGNDASLDERLEYYKSSLQTIQENIFFGNYGYDGIDSEYVHSALDLWAQFGIIPFVAFCMMIVWNPIILLIKSYLFGRDKCIIKYNCMPVLIFLCIEFAVFRHPENIILFFGVGALVAMSATKNFYTTETSYVEK